MAAPSIDTRVTGTSNTGHSITRSNGPGGGSGHSHSFFRWAIDRSEPEPPLRISTRLGGVGVRPLRALHSPMAQPMLVARRPSANSTPTRRNSAGRVFRPVDLLPSKTASWIFPLLVRHARCALGDHAKVQQRTRRVGVDVAEHHGEPICLPQDAPFRDECSHDVIGRTGPGRFHGRVGLRSTHRFGDLEERVHETKSRRRRPARPVANWRQIRPPESRFCPQFGDWGGFPDLSSFPAT